MASNKQTPEPIAIIGMGMRLPGNVSTGQDFWNLLINKENGRCRVPKDRYNVDGFLNQGSRKEAVATEYGYFLENVNYKAYDTAFFGGTRNESQSIDPQQRLLLQVVWECMEDAGQTKLQGTNTGVYVGSYGEDWNQLVHQDTQSSNVYRVLSTSDFILSNRISYQYDLQGPSITIRTACSAAMTGLHLACQAINSGEIPAAIVAGSSFILSPSMTQDMTAQGVLSPSGLCKTFDSSADGYARAEGVTALLIKPLADAIRDGDPVRAVIRSTTINSDGKTSNIGVPSVQRQMDMIREAYDKAGITDLSQTPFVECHGTGTSVGDPLEATAIAKAFGNAGTYLGSVKTNIGHTEGASGITSIIKAVLALENETIPPNMNFSTPNPNIPFEEYNLKVPVEPTPWPKDRHARASINCFGIGGANAHVILDSAASFGIHSQAQQSPNKSNGYPNHTPPIVNGHDPNEPATNNATNRPLLVPVSAASSISLRSRITDIKQHIEASQLDKISEIAYTLGAHRTHFSHRAFTVLDDTKAESSQQELGFISSPPSTKTVTSDIVYVFNGQGAHWVGMARELCQKLPTFRHDIQEMDFSLQQLDDAPDWSIENLLSAETDKDAFNRAEVAQPLCTAVQLALVNLLKSYGLNPCAVVGHSSGEIAAAYAAGALTMTEAITCSYLRGLSIHRHTSGAAGTMAAIGLGPEKVNSFLIERTQIACINSPDSVTISGDKDAIGQVIKSIQAQNKDSFIRELPVGVAYHSHQMSEVGPIYQEMLSKHLTTKEKTLVPFYSTVAGDLLPCTSQLSSAGYWRENLELPVRFSTAVNAVLQKYTKDVVFLEIGPHAALRGPLRQIFQQARATSSKSPPIHLPTLLRDKPDISSLLTTIGHLYNHGCTIEFSAVNPPTPVYRNLPLYPWDESTELWKDTRVSREWRMRANPHHELLGSICTETSRGSCRLWRNVIGLLDIPWLKDHMVGKDVVFPCAAYVAMIGEAIRQLTGSRAYTLRDVVIKSAMVIHETDTVEVMTSVNPLRLTDFSSSSWFEFSISSFNGNSWVEHCVGQGKAAVVSSAPTEPPVPSFPRIIPTKYFYNCLSRAGLKFGPNFRQLTNISADTKRAIARASIEQRPGDGPDTQYTLHPCQIDALLQVSAVAMSQGVIRDFNSVKIPVRIGAISVTPPPTDSLVAQAKAVEKQDISSAGRADIRATTVNGDPVADISDVRFLKLDTGDSDTQRARDSQLAGCIEWRPHIDFVDIKQTLRAGIPVRHLKTGMEKVIAICILRIVHQLKSLDLYPTEGHLSKYATWLDQQRDQMLRGEYSFVPDATRFATLDQNDLQIEVNKAFAELDAHQNEAVSGVTRLIMILAEPESVRSLFSGEVHSMQLLTENTGLMDFYSYYCQVLNARDFFQMTAYSVPNLKIIEIGGGTAGTTEAVLNSLVSANGTKMFSKYTFTDISAGFFASAQDRLGDWGDRIEYQKLDITQDPSEQGFTLGSYDIVVASNVLHATPSLQETLKNVRLLLRPGGRLYLQELITPTNQRLANFIAGTLSGWWAGDKDGRTNEPTISVERWDRELKSAGFGGVEAAVLDDDDPFYATIAQMTSVVPLTCTDPSDITILYDTDKPDFAQRLAISLEHLGHQVQWLSLDEKRDSLPKHMVAAFDIEKPYFHEITKDSFDKFMNLISRAADSGILWLTRSAQIECTNPAYGQILGLSRTIRSETQVDFWTVEIQHIEETSPVTTLVTNFINRPTDVRQAADREFAIHNGSIHVGRYDWNMISTGLQPELEPNDPKRLTIARPGMLDSLHWVQEPTVATLQNDDVEVTMRCTGLNFRDIMVAMGLLQGIKASNGYEGAGIVTRIGSSVNHLVVGDRVLVVCDGLFNTKRVIPSQFAVRIPDTINFQGAATMPIVYCTVIHAVVNNGGLKRGQSILIQSACGGVGLAAIQISKMLGLEIFATVGSEEKIQYLIDNYQIQRHRIFNSRNASFYDGIMKETGGRGVDLVLNSLSGDLLHASWRCVAKWGKMMEIGKRDLLGRGNLALELFGENRTFCGINLDSMFDDPEMFCGLMKQMLQYYTEGHIQPIGPIHSFPADKIADAFRYMQQGTHIGKIIVEFPEDTSEIPAVAAPSEVSFSGSRTYLMVGGLSGLGKLLASWMVERGARSFVFMSRSAGSSASDKAFLHELETQDCSVIAVTGSVAILEDVVKAINTAPTPIAGVMQLSMVLKDLPLLDITHDDWNIVQDPKVKGTWNLHEALTSLDLDFFILFSSLSALFGRSGQANYASANSFMGSFAQFRNGLGLPCSVIDIGAVSGVGTVSQAGRLEQQLNRSGLMPIHENILIDAIQLSIKESRPETRIDSNTAQPIQANSKATSENTYTNKAHIGIGMMSTKSINDPSNTHPIRNDIRTSLAWQLMGKHENLGDKSKGETLRQLMSFVESDPTVLHQTSIQEQIIMEIGRTLCNFMMIPEENMDINEKLETLGVDSLVSIEIRHWIRSTFRIEVSVLEITNTGTIAGLGDLAVNALKDKFGMGEERNNASSADTNGHRLDLCSEYQRHMDRLDRYLDSSQTFSTRPALPDKASVFLTGATGYLGTEILSQLLQNDAIATVIVLVRANSIEKGLDRIIQTATTAEWWIEAYKTKIEVWLGDLSKERLGCTDDQWLRIQGQSVDQSNIDAIVHNGALVSLSASYESLQAQNVESTIQLIEAALISPVLSRFVFVSGGFKMDLTKTFDEIADDLSSHINYSQTKILSERIVADIGSLSMRGKFSVVKPGLIIGAATNGVTNVDDMLWTFVAICASANRFPVDVQDRWMYLSPVDKVATKIIRPLFEDAERFVDIVDGIFISDFWKTICQELNLTYSAIPWDDWIQDARDQFPEFTADSAALSLVQRLILDNSTALPNQQPHDAENVAEMQSAVQSSVLYLDSIGFIKTGAGSRKKMDAKTIIRRSGK